jgi:putative DNA methylase
LREQPKYRKKLIEVALPLEAINEASAREKSIRHGHPSTLHLWWARRPLAAARAVIFAQMVDDPSSYPDLFPTEKAQEKERQRLFRIIEDLVRWENTTNEEVIQKARDEIWRSWRRTCAENADHPRADELFNRDKLPAFHDPFAGGGALPLEAQRLGLEAYASDLNPVAVLINKAMIEIPPKFAGIEPVNPEWRKKNHNEKMGKTWKGAQGLADDVRYYGQWMRDEAEKRIGHLYPKIEITTEMVRERPDLKKYEGQKLTVIAWIWTRTVKSPNPAFAEVDVPLASTFMLSSKKGKEAWVEPVIDGLKYHFKIRNGKPKEQEKTKLGTTAGKRSAFICLMSGIPVTYNHIREQGKSGRMGSRLMAIVAEGKNGRVYLSPNQEHNEISSMAKPEWFPEIQLPNNPRDFKTPNYGMNTFADLFTPRQLVALTTFSDLVAEAREKIKSDAITAGLVEDGIHLRDDGLGATAYSEAISLYLSFAINRTTNTLCTIARWTTDRQQTVTAFSRQAIPMTWDYPEVNPFAHAAGDFGVSVSGVVKGIPSIQDSNGFALISNASSQEISQNKIVSTDPPYYDNIGYADLSDFFYVWLRKTMKHVFPEIFSLLSTPKEEELIATPYRHKNKEEAEIFFLRGMSQAIQRISTQSHPGYPISIYYAFKQSEKKGDEGILSTGWATFLDAVFDSGLTIQGTWPIRTEMSNRMIGSGTNALASSIVLICRKREVDLPTISRREFSSTLKNELPLTLKDLQRGNIAPVDLAQASIGPGMAIFTRYEKVLDAEGNPLKVRDALALINQVLDEVLAEQEGDFDADTRFAIAWFDQFGFKSAEFGQADVLARAKDTAVSGLVAAGILESGHGKVRLLIPEELPENWDPATDKRLTVWEMVHHLIRILEGEGESATGKMVAKLGSKAETARELAYLLYNICERRKRATEAAQYNGLVQSWPELIRLSKETPMDGTLQTDMFSE